MATEKAAGLTATDPELARTLRFSLDLLLGAAKEVNQGLEGPERQAALQQVDKSVLHLVKRWRRAELADDALRAVADKLEQEGPRANLDVDKVRSGTVVTCRWSV